MVEFYEIDRDLLSERRFTVMLDGIALFYIGFARETMITNRVYITLEPLPSLRALRKSSWKALQAMFDEMPSAIYYCQVAKTHKSAQRFVTFFGFVPAEEIEGRIEYVRSIG